MTIPNEISASAVTMAPMRILVVDDEPAVCRTLERALRFDGYDVESATDGLDASTGWPRSAPDAIVLDRMMPRLDGIELCRRLREAGDRTPILVLTARRSGGPPRGGPPGA
jgi:two-component system response regulator MprA